MAATKPNLAENKADRSPNDLARLAEERQRLVEALALAERDRQLLGYDLHDGVVQDLTAATLLLESAGKHAQFASAETQDSYASGLRLLRESIAEARRLIRGLATVELNEQGLPHALQRLIDKFRIDHGLPATFVGDAGNLSLPASVQHLLLRIAQEALFNVWKHAQATQVEVRLAADERELELSVSDDGVGFDPDRVPPGHFGLEGIRARARVLGARLEIASAGGKGTRISVRLTTPDAI
jgi:two-component system sensor histidine kinase DegS